MLRQMAEIHGAKVLVSPKRYNPDNGVQIAIVGLYLHEHNLSVPVEKAIVKQRWRLDEVDIPWRM
mgnify:FL=1